MSSLIEPRKIVLIKRKKYIKKIEEPLLSTPNRGNGAGGRKTNETGKNWEMITSNLNNLINDGFTRSCEGNLFKINKNYTLTYFTQCELKCYFKKKYDISIFRNPDEAYLLELNDGRKILKILEKKYQNVEGSVEDKLLTGNQIKREYTMKLQSLNIEVSYAYCVSQFLEKKLKSNKDKYIIWNKMFLQDDITLFYGGNDNYFLRLNEWINSF